MNEIALCIIPYGWGVTLHNSEMGFTHRFFSYDKWRIAVDPCWTSLIITGCNLILAEREKWNN